MNDQSIAVCGLNCSECDIFKASADAQIAQEIADWFKEERDKEVKLEDIRCSGCRGDRSKHWSPDCWILECCVDNKGLKFCSQCEDFPCKKLKEWSGKNEGYKKALQRLKRMNRQ